MMEDIHWADESTRHLLRFLARALTDAPVMIIASYRTDELTRRHPLRPFLAEIGRLNGTVRVEVGNLDRAEVAELLAQLLDRPPSNPVIDMVFRRSEGIPYFVEELTRSAVRGCIDMPDTLRDALNVRIQTLSDEAQRVVEFAAVAGNRVDHQLLEAAASGTGVDLDLGLREAIDTFVLTADETGYSFRHALLREVVHDDLMPGQHARLHARFAAIMEARPELVGAGTAALEIAHHWSAAHETNKAFRWSITAARSGSAAYHETLKMYERALELWDQVEEPEAVAGSRAVVLKQAAVAAHDAGEDERALALVSAALTEAGPGGSPEERIKALMLKALQLASLMRPGSVDPLREAVTLLLDDASPILRGRVLDDLAKRMMLTGEVAGGVEVAYQAAEAAKEAGRVAERQAADGLKPGAGGSVDWLLSNVHNTLGTGLAAIGEESAGLAEYDLARDLARGNTKIELRYFINYSDVLHLTGRYQDSVDQALAGIELARSKGLERSMGAMLAGNAAEPMIALGQWEQAYAMIKRALELDPPAHHTAHLRLLQAWLRIWRGELEEADAVLVEFRKLIVDGQHAPQYASQVIRTNTEHALAVGDHERAWANVTVYFEPWDSYHSAWAYPLLALAAAAATALDHQDRGGRRSATVQEFVDQHARKINIRPFWLPVITAELADTADGWRTALEQLDGLPVPAHCPRTPAFGWPSIWLPRENEQRPRWSWAPPLNGRPGSGLACWSTSSSADPAGRVCRGVGVHAHPAGRADPAGDRGAAAGGRRPIQRRDRQRFVHQHQDRQRPRVQHLGQAGRQRSRRGRRPRAPARTRARLNPRIGGNSLVTSAA